MKKILLLFLINLFISTSSYSYEVPGNEGYKYKIGDNVFLNACKQFSNRFFDKPLNINNIIIEVPNKITSLKASVFDIGFQTLATSNIIKDNDNLNITITNFRYLSVKNVNQEILFKKKIKGTSSIYELKFKGKVIAWGIGWHKECKEFNRHVDFTTMWLLIPIVNKGKIIIQEKLVRLNLSKTYKTITQIHLLFTIFLI